MIYESTIQQSFGGKEIRHGNCMSTFKILGQPYHKFGSLAHEETKCLQIYFIGNEELERLLSICPHTNRNCAIKVFEYYR